MYKIRTVGLILSILKQCCLWLDATNSEVILISYTSAQLYFTRSKNQYLSYLWPNCGKTNQQTRTNIQTVHLHKMAYTRCKLQTYWSRIASVIEGKWEIPIFRYYFPRITKTVTASNLGVSVPQALIYVRAKFLLS